MAAARILPLIVFLTITFTGCIPREGANRSGAREADVNLPGTHWVLVSLDGESPLEGSRITIEFAEDRLSGFAGCNRYGAEYTVDRGAGLTVAEPVHNVALCDQPEGVMAQEDAFLEALCAAAAYRSASDRLEIDDAAGTTRLIFVLQERQALDPAALVGTRWELLTLAAAEPVEGTRYTLSFDSATGLSGDAGCRTYRGTYEAAGDELHLRYLEMGGDPCLDREDVMRQEGAFTTALGSIDQYRLSDDRLEFVTQRGEVLVFARVE